MDILGRQLVEPSTCKSCDGGGFNRDARGAGIGGGSLRQDRASDWRPDHVLVLLRRDLQLRRPQDGIDARIDKRSQGHRPIDRDAVFQVGHNAQIAAGENDLIHRNRDGHIARQRILRVLEVQAFRRDWSA